jgi:purine nucleosidase
MDPSIARLYNDVVVMGGACLAPGNITRAGEANIARDPGAAQMVLEAGWPVTLVGLDVTERVRVSQAMFERLRASGTPAGRHLDRITADYLAVYERRVGARECAMHDALALGIAADRSLVRQALRVRVDVELAGAHTRGMTVADLRPGATPAGPRPGGPAEPNAAVVLEVDRQRFLNRWLEVLCQPRA